MIPNHYTPRLSDLDMQMVRAVPPGGNWKDIPRTIPSKRLDQIRLGFAQGNGSRSTYYGRLHPARPSYTISTYFNRPGNGCHIHYDYEGGQHRLISQREAARLQSFPDEFVFFGSRASVNKQIGNAVPPLLAYQVARSLGPPGRFVDLFCGAGGLSLGFIWAGWEPIIASDIDRDCVKSYSENVHDQVFDGDIRNSGTVDRILDVAGRRGRASRESLLVLGGPPCQGFSTAGNRRSRHDERNSLFESYARVLESVKPTGFVFENVPGLLNMEKGEVLKTIQSVLAATGFEMDLWQLRADAFAIPQRRARIMIIGRASGLAAIQKPIPLLVNREVTDRPDALTHWVSVSDAISDLPPLIHGEDGEQMEYSASPTGAFQLFSRGTMSAAYYVSCILDGSRR